MSQRAARKYREEVPPAPERPMEPIEEQRILRRRQLDQVLSHQGKFELDLDQETLAQLRSAR